MLTYVKVCDVDTLVSHRALDHYVRLIYEFSSHSLWFDRTRRDVTILYVDIYEYDCSM